MTIGKLADRLQMSKSGVFAHFGSKEELQLATIDAAQAIYVGEIVQPALGVPAGIGRVRALVDAFLSYSERHVFPGGCFFGAIELFLDQARDNDELRPDVDTARVAFELASLLTAADWSHNLHGDGRPLDLARRAIAERIDSLMPRP